MSPRRMPQQLGTRYEVLAGERVGVARLEGRAEVIVEAALATAAGLSLGDWGRAVDRLPIPELAIDFIDRRGRSARGRPLAWLDRLAELRADEALVAACEGANCAELALLAVLAFHGFTTTPAARLAALGTTAEGTPSGAAVRALQRLGVPLRARAIMLPAELVRWLPSPAIVSLPGHAEALLGSRGELVRTTSGWTRAGVLARAAMTSATSAARLTRVVRDWPLAAALVDLGVGPVLASRLAAESLADESCRRAAAVDAAIRYVHALRAGGEIGRGQIESTLARLVDDDDQIPIAHWRVRPVEDELADLLDEMRAMPAAEREETLVAVETRPGEAAPVDDEGPAELPPGGAWRGYLRARLALVILVRRVDEVVA